MPLVNNNIHSIIWLTRLFILTTNVFPSGIFVALALRFDVSRGKQPQYFKSAFLGYTFGLVLTIVVMNWFQAAQVTGYVVSFFFLFLLCFSRKGVVTLLLTFFTFLLNLVFSPPFYILYLLLLDFWLLIAYGTVKSNRYVSLSNFFFSFFINNRKGA